MKNNKLIWPEVLLTGKIPDSYKQESEWKMKAMLCADGLCGWGNCRLEMRPEMFGTGLVAIGKELGVSPTEDGLMEYAKTIQYEEPAK